MSQAVVAWGLVVLIGGVAGLLAMAVCNYILSFGGEDSAGKHGISTVRTTRLGGVVIVAYMLMHLSFQVFVGLYSPSVDHVMIMLICVAYFTLGLYEDLHNTLSARLRFALMLVVGILTMYFAPGLILKPVGIFWVDSIVGLTTVAGGLFTALCVAFLPNAFNTADGANGLIAGVSAFTFAGLILIAPPVLIPFLLAAVVGCLLFLVCNLVSGRFFLGDGGAYFLGALAGLSLVIVSNTSDVSVWWLLALVFYPVADLIWSMGRRLRQGVSLLRPDNRHFHNYFFVFLDSGAHSSIVANTITGISIAIFFSGLPLLLSIITAYSPSDDAWFVWVLLQWCTYVTGWFYLNNRLDTLSDANVRNVTSQP